MLLVVLLSLVLIVSAQGAEIDAAGLKVAFIYNFAKCTQWSERSDTAGAREMWFCQLTDGAGLPMYRLAGKSIDGKSIAVRRLSGPAQATECHLLFVAGQTAAGLVDIHEFARLRGVLVIGDGGTFAREGGMIGLVRRGNKFAFHLNQAAAMAARIRFSSKLMRLAEVVHDHASFSNGGGK